MSPFPIWPAADADHLLVTAAQMAALEERLFASGLPVAALMEKAALAMSRRLLVGEEGAAAALAPGQGVLVLVGPGHNGGDGLVIARELHLAGVGVRIWCPFERLKPLTEDHLRHALWLGIPQLESTPEPGDPDLWIDALFGIGQSRSPGERLETLLEERQSCRPQALFAVDGPTGLCADTGRLLGRGGATAQRTWSIGLIKRGFIQDKALARVGQLERIDLGLPLSLLASLPGSTPLALTGRDGPSAPWPRPDPAAAKYARGRLLVVAGSRRFRGAAHLALAGARASGCGSLRAALPRELVANLWTVHPEVVLTAELGANAAGGLDLTPLADLDLDRLDVILLGPGLGGLGDAEPAAGLQASTPSAAGPGLDSGRASAAQPGSERFPEPEAALGLEVRPDPQEYSGFESTASPRPIPAPELELWSRLQAFPGLLVLDADGLNRLVRCSSWLAAKSGAEVHHWSHDDSRVNDGFGSQGLGSDPGSGCATAHGSEHPEDDVCVWLRLRRGVTWITPHAAEFARLFPALQALETREAASEAARRSGATVLLKGARTVVAAADGRCWQLLQAAPQAARGGLGDVLAGYAAGRAALALAGGSEQRGWRDARLRPDASLLAAVALLHAQAGMLCLARCGPGGVSPQAVAAELQRL